MTSNWCGYIDMLATRSLARRDPQLLLEALQNFHGALQKGFENFTNGEIYAFSDGAFFVCDDLNEFYSFYRMIRNELFQAGLFFKCSFMPGRIAVIEQTVSPKGRSVQQKGKRRFFSMTFVEDAPKAYQMESEFKGVGCTINLPNGPKKRTGNVVESYYLVHDGTKFNVRNNIDFKYSERELSHINSDDILRGQVSERPLFDQLVSACHSTLTQSNKIAAYYVSAFASAVRSMDLGRVEYDIERGWINTPYVFEELISGGVTRALRQLPGLHLILLTCFDHLYEQLDGNIPDNVENVILLRFLRVPNCFRNLDQVPTFVISEKARHRLIELRVASERRKRILIKSESRKKGLKGEPIK